MTKFSDEPMSPLVRKLELPEGKILDAIVADDLVLYYNRDGNYILDSRKYFG